MIESPSIAPAARNLARHGVAYAPEIAGAAQRHGVNPDLLAEVAAQETGGRGVFQIDDRWHAFARSAAAMNPQANADYAAGMIAGLLQQYGGDVHKALSAYNAGNPNANGTVTAWQDGRRLGYADSVLRHYADKRQRAVRFTRRQLGGTAKREFAVVVRIDVAAAGARKH